MVSAQFLSAGMKRALISPIWPLAVFIIAILLAYLIVRFMPTAPYAGH
jgi:hypothetical protein